jgi:hypothetical protein
MALLLFKNCIFHLYCELLIQYFVQPSCCFSVFLVFRFSFFIYLFISLARFLSLTLAAPPLPHTHPRFLCCCCCSSSSSSSSRSSVSFSSSRSSVSFSSFSSFFCCLFPLLFSLLQAYLASVGRATLAAAGAPASATSYGGSYPSVSAATVPSAYPAAAAVAGGVPSLINSGRMCNFFITRGMMCVWRGGGGHVSDVRVNQSECRERDKVCIFDDL